MAFRHQASRIPDGLDLCIQPLFSPINCVNGLDDCVFEFCFVSKKKIISLEPINIWLSLNMCLLLPAEYEVLGLLGRNKQVPRRMGTTGADVCSSGGAHSNLRLVIPPQELSIEPVHSRYPLPQALGTVLFSQAPSPPDRIGEITFPA